MNHGDPTSRQLRLARDPERHRLPHFAPQEPPNQSIVIFLTVCVAGRRPLLARPEIHHLLRSVWTTANHWRVGRYVLMPDHLHLFCAPATYPATPLRNWVQFWRATATREWPFPNERPIWQRDFFDRQLRRGESYHEKWMYVVANPVRAGLVEQPQDWPYQAEFHVLEWHERT